MAPQKDKGTTMPLKNAKEPSAPYNPRTNDGLVNE